MLISEDNEQIQEPITPEEPSSGKRRSMGLTNQLCVGEETFRHKFFALF